LILITQNSNNINNTKSNNNNKELVELVETNTDGILRIWNFNTGKIIKKVKFPENKLYGICLLNKNYIFVGVMIEKLGLLN